MDTPRVDLTVRLTGMQFACAWCGETIGGRTAAGLVHAAAAHVSRHQAIPGHCRRAYLTEIERSARWAARAL